MFEAKRHIRIGAEEWVEDIEDNHVDVVVTFPDATLWIADFYTIKCIESIRQDYSENGHCLNGAYWCSNHVIIVDNVSRARIEQVVDELITKNEFQYAFEYFGAVNERDLELTQYPEHFFDGNSKIDPSYVSWHAVQLKQMLDQSSPETREKILKEILEISP
ncbi:hypothetical protein [Paenibacillus sp. TH7-28]